MMMFRAVTFALVLLFASISFSSAQVYESDVFIEFSSAQAGSQSEGCLVASMAGMIASLNEPSIGTNTTRILKGMGPTLCNSGSTFPYPTTTVISAAINFLVTVLG